MGNTQRFLLYACTWLLLYCMPVSVIGADQVTLQLKWFHQFQFAGYYAAKEKGFGHGECYVLPQYVELHRAGEH